MRRAVLLSSSLLLAASVQGGEIVVRVSNPLAVARPSETVDVPVSALAGRVSPAELPLLVVADGRSRRELLSQAVDDDGDGTYDRLVFQADFAPRESRDFVMVRGERRKPRSTDYRVYGRFNRERLDDFAWENDRVAFRLYGQALETFEKEPLTSSAVDAWSKRTRRLVVNDWYLVDDYHQDHGEGGDFYPAGRTRGCGGSGLIVDGALAVSRNFRASRVLASGPIRLVFEVVYPEWETPGLKATEVKRVTLDAGSHFNRFESVYALAGEGPITWAAGIRTGEAVATRVDQASGLIRTWEQQTRYGDGGWLGCGLVIPDPASVVETREEGGSRLLVARSPRGAPAVWYAGSAWDRGGEVPDLASWDSALEAFAARVRQPLRVEIAP